MLCAPFLFLYEILLAVPGMRHRQLITAAVSMTLAVAVTLATGFAAFALDAGVFAVPPPTGNSAADLAAIEAAVAEAKT